MAREDVTAGYDKIVGYLKGVSINLSATTVKKILKEHGVPPAPERKYRRTWSSFIREHRDVMWGCDFFTQETWSKRGELLTFYILVFIHLGTRRLEIVNLTTSPTAEWTAQQARNFLYDLDSVPEKRNMRYLLHDKGSQFGDLFESVFSFNELNEQIMPITVSSAQMNSHCERVIQSIQNECTEKLIFFGEKMLRHSLKQYQEHYNHERHHQGIGNVVPFPLFKPCQSSSDGRVECKTRLGGLLWQYFREAI